MSTDLTSMKPAGAQLPAAFQGRKAAAIFLEHEMETGSEGIEGSYPIIKFAGKVWSLQYRGENRKFMRPDGDGPRGSIDAIFIRMATNKAKTFYPPGFKDGSKEKPICWSNDGAKPDAAVPPSQKQAPACAACAKNVFGSRVTDDGKQAKACGDHKRTAVVLDPALVMAVLGMPLNEPALLRIPAASLNDFSTFADTMKAQGYPLQSFVCKISFDPTKNFPKFKFEAVRPLSPEEGAIVMAFRDDPVANRIISESASAISDGAEEPGQDVTANAMGNTTTTIQGPNLGASANTQSLPLTAVPNPPNPPNVVPLNVAPRAEALNPNPLQNVAGPTAVQTDRPSPQQQAEAMAAAQAAGQTASTPTPTPTPAPTPPAAVSDFDADITNRINQLLG